MTAGYIWSLLSALLWSTTFLCARYLVAGEGAHPVALSALRFVGGSLALVAVGLVWQPRRLLAVRWRDAAPCAGLALLGMFGMSVFLFYGQRQVGAGAGAVLMQVSPVFIVLLGVAAGERLTRRAAGGILVSLTGTLLMVANGGSLRALLHHSAGSGLVLVSALSWALYTVLSRGLVRRLGGFAATTWVMVAGALELLLAAALLRLPLVVPGGPRAWWVVAYLAVFPTALAYFAYYEALQRIRLEMLNVMQYLTPVFTILLAWVLMGERLALPQWGGTALVILGVALVSWRSGKTPDGPW